MTFISAALIIVDTIAGSTRWLGTDLMMNNFIKSRIVYERLIDVLPRFREFISSGETWSNAEVAADFQKQMGIMIKRSQADSTMISDVPEIISDIQAAVTHFVDAFGLTRGPEGDHLIDLMLARFGDEKDVSPHHYLANMLDPRFRGAKLDLHTQISSKQLLSSYYEAVVLTNPLVVLTHASSPPTAVVKAFHDFQTQSGIFAHIQYSSDSISSPVVFWKTIEQAAAFVSDGESGHQQLASIAIRLLSIPASSASTERSFSLMNRILTKYRNKLSHDRLMKLQIVAAMDKHISTKGGNVCKKKHQLSNQSQPPAAVLAISDQTDETDSDGPLIIGDELLELISNGDEQMQFDCGSDDESVQDLDP